MSESTSRPRGGRGGRGGNRGRGHYHNTNNKQDKSHFYNRSYWKKEIDQPDITPQELTSDEQKRKERAARFSKDKATNNEEYGFVSRGEDDRLQKSRKEREVFFTQIVEKFMAYCEANDSCTLSKNLSNFLQDYRLETNHETKTKEVDPKTKETNATKESKVTIDSILTSLRKLRESMINAPCDNFTIKVFLFSIRISANIGHYQTYLPSIYFLLENHRQHLLAPFEKTEIVTLLILHLSHFNKFNLKAYKEYFKYFNPQDHHDGKLLLILNSWCNQDYYTWVKLYNAEPDIAKSTIMRFGISLIMETLITNIGRAYFHLDKHYLTHTLLPNGVSYEDLHQTYNVKWKLEGTNVIIRQRKVNKS